jgi:hypothetical protein
MNKRQRLLGALERLKNGTPERISPKRKITPTSVEDEAGVSRSLLRNNPDYVDIFNLVVIEKNKQKPDSENKKLSSSTITPETKAEIREYKSTIKGLRSEVSDWQQKYNELLARNAELTILIHDKRFTEFLNKSSTTEIKSKIDTIASRFK